MVLTAYSPLGKGGALDQPALKTIAEKHHATPAQVALAWLLAQPGVAMVPKAASPARQRENLSALSIRLDEADLAALAALPKDRRFVSPAMAPDWENGGPSWPIGQDSIARCSGGGDWPRRGRSVARSMTGAMQPALGTVCGPSGPAAA
jgi:hypothetical protein